MDLDGIIIRTYCVIDDGLKAWLGERRLRQRGPKPALVDSFPLLVCQFARAPRCKRFRADAAFGKDTVLMQTFWGFRVHARLSWPGVITRFSVAPPTSRNSRYRPSS